MSTSLSLFISSIICVVKLSGICIDVGIISDYRVISLLWLGRELWLGDSDALYRLQGCRVISSKLSMGFRLSLIIIWGYILWMICRPLMVTAQYGRLPRSLYYYIQFPRVGYTSVSYFGWRVMTGCRKKLGNLG